MAQAISYIRFSHPAQKLGDSERRQYEATVAYCQKHGHELNDTLRDEGVSAFRGQHLRKGALGNFLRLVDKNIIKPGTLLILEDLDRFSRQETDQAVHSLLTLILKGIEVVTLRDEKTYSQSSGTKTEDLIRAVLRFSTANEESEKKSARLSEAWAEKRRKAAQGRPLTSTRPAWINITQTDHGIECTVDEKKAQIVRSIFRDCISGMGSYIIAKRLNEAGVPSMIDGTRGKHGWYKNTITQILTSQRVLGWYQPHTGRGAARKPVGNVIKDYYPQIVDPDQYQLAQAALASRGNLAGRKGNSYSNLFTKIAKCSLCNSPAVITHRSTKTSGYLRCDRSLRGGACSNSSGVHYEGFEKAVLECLQGIILEPNLVDDSTDELDRLITGEREKVAEFGSQIERLVDAIAYGTDPEGLSPLIERIAVLRREQASAQAKKDNLERQLLSLKAKIPAEEYRLQILDYLERMYTGSDRDRYEVRAMVAGSLREIITSISITHGCADVTFGQGLFKLHVDPRRGQRRK